MHLWVLPLSFSLTHPHILFHTGAGDTEPYANFANQVIWGEQLFYIICPITWVGGEETGNGQLQVYKPGALQFGKHCQKLGESNISISQSWHKLTLKSHKTYSSTDISGNNTMWNDDSHPSHIDDIVWREIEMTIACIPCWMRLQPLSASCQDGWLEKVNVISLTCHLLTEPKEACCIRVLPSLHRRQFVYTWNWQKQLTKMKNIMRKYLPLDVHNWLH